MAARMTSSVSDVQENAYDCQPEDAAEIYALELPPLEPGSICNYSPAARSPWVLAYKLAGASDDQLAAGLNAAKAVLDAAVFLLLRPCTPHTGLKDGTSRTSPTNLR